MRRFAYLIILINVILVAGCSDPCDDQVCLNGGDCLDGDCICPTGWTGTHCETASGGGGGGGGGSTGTATFWSNQSGSPITVQIGGYSGSITSYYPNNGSGNPVACNTSGCFNITLNYGSYNYSASDGTHNWSGTLTISTSCYTNLLYW